MLSVNPFQRQFLELRHRRPAGPVFAQVPGRAGFRYGTVSYTHLAQKILREGDIREKNGQAAFEAIEKQETDQEEELRLSLIHI